MTHDELLYGIERQILTQTDEYLLFNALRAVVELHKPVEYDNELYCDFGCNYDIRDKYHSVDWCKYPCPTIKAIEDSLNG